MAGVCVNVAFYGMWRTLALLGRTPGWLVGALLVLGALTALLGIAHAAVQNRLSRVIAYSSIENTGLIVTGFGIALTGAATGDRRLIAGGLLAATLQIVAHTAAKSLLFTSAAGIEAAVGGEDDLEALRGRARHTPWSGFGLAVGSLTLAGLPPTAGFVSEWFLLESLMQQFRVPGLGYRLVLALAGAAVALTAGFAGVTFVRLVGLIVLGRKPAEPLGEAGITRGSGALGRSGAQGAADYGWAGRTAVLVLSGCCLAIAAVTPLEIRVIAAGLSPDVPSAVTMGALKSPWVLQPVFAGFSILSPSWLWLVMPVMLLLVVLFTWAMSGRRLLRVRRVPAWHSATMGVDGLDSYTAFGYANPTRRVLAGVLHTRAEVQEIMLEDPDPDQGAGPPDRPGDPEPEEVAHLRYASDVMEVVEAYLYRPLLRAFLAVVAVAKRLQLGAIGPAGRGQRAGTECPQHDTDDQRAGGQLAVGDLDAGADRLQRDVDRTGQLGGGDRARSLGVSAGAARPRARRRGRLRGRRPDEREGVRARQVCARRPENQAHRLQRPLLHGLGRGRGAARVRDRACQHLAVHRAGHRAAAAHRPHAGIRLALDVHHDGLGGTGGRGALGQLLPRTTQPDPHRGGTKLPHRW